MFESSKILCIYVETALHAGTGQGIGAIDLPIQRERITGYPMVQGSGLKGRLRAEAEGKLTNKDERWAIFGPDTDNADEHAGALSCGDAKILLLPVRSLKGVFAWVTSRQVLERFQRDLALVGVPDKFSRALADIREESFENEQGDPIALVNEGNEVAVDNTHIILEEFAYQIKSLQVKQGDDQNQVVDPVAEIGKFLAGHVLPQTAEYTHWRTSLSKHLVILPEDDFRDFCQYGTEVVTRIKIKDSTKTVEDGGLWTEEYLPADTLLYAPLHATQSRKGGTKLSAQEILEKVEGIGLKRIVLGGNETVGRGIVHLQFMSASQTDGSALEGKSNV